MNETKKKWHVYHMIQPYFFAHQHLHRRKIKELRESGTPSWAITFVPEGLYQKHRTRYEESITSGYVKVVRVSREKQINREVFKFFIRQIVLGNRVLVHVLRTDPSSVIKIRYWPIIGHRLRYVLEYEGDMPSELVYDAAYIEDPRPPEKPPEKLHEAYERMLSKQISDANQADGLVLMSQEQINLWEVRLGRGVNSCCLPSLFDSERVFFSSEERAKIRTRLNISDRVVFTYAGNVVCKWQRLDAMCQLIARLAKEFPSLWFLALVRIDDIELAKEAISSHGIESCSTVMHVHPNEIASYLSAADCALFLRHDHIMNRVVTSGKLGEYLASGLPVVTTGANAEVLNRFISETQSGVFLTDTLHVSEEFVVKLKELLDRSSDPSWRFLLSHAAVKSFAGGNDPLRSYEPFIRKICHKADR